MDYSESLNMLKKECGNAKIMAVSKTRTLEEVKGAYKAGFRIFGENHVQEIVEKFSAWHPDDVQVHMIGHLQSNKVNKVVPLVDMIQSVDSLSLLEKINNCAARIGKVMPVLLELNTSGEESKTGFTSENELVECFNSSRSMTNVEVRGLMTVGPLDHSLAADAFSRLKVLADKLGLNEVSMGMSQDYKTAVQEGSSMVRIGTLIFGERIYMKKFLIVVDMQHDFIDGSLGSPSAKDTVLPNVVKKIEDNRKNGDYLIFTQDTHFEDYLNTFEGKHLPVEHCIKDTEGWKIHKDIMNLPLDFKNKCSFVCKNTFGSFDLPGVIKSYLNGNEAFELEFCGLCTDICVVSNALICRAQWPDVRITVDPNACGGTSTEAHNAAVTVMKSCQIEQI